MMNNSNIFQNIKYKVREKCAVCGVNLSEPLIRLPKFPLTEIYTKTKPVKLTGFTDQNFHFCPNCGHGQISHILDPKVLYSQSAYFFRTSQSKSATKANDVFLAFILDITRGIFFEKIVEIGCSDLYLIKSLEKYASELIGIDPILESQEKELTKGKLRVYGDFFENLDIDLASKKGKSLVISSHTLEHMDNPRSHLIRLMEKANEKTIFVYQFPGLETLVTDSRYDQIFHQHLQYFSLESFCRLLDETGGELIKSRVNYLHWGSLMVAFRKRKNKTQKTKSTSAILLEKIKTDYPVFKSRMRQVNNYLNSLNGEKIYGFGAALMLPILGYHLNNDFSKFTAILDDDENKNGLFYINLPVKISLPAIYSNLGESNVVVTALNTTRGIMNRVLSFSPKRIILPMPVI